MLANKKLHTKCNAHTILASQPS